MQNNTEKNNQVYISGEVVSEGKFSHETYGENFYEYTVKVPRLSGTNDLLPITISERITPSDMAVGKTIHALGQFRSYNKIVDGRSRLLLTVFIRELLDEPADCSPNAIILSGYVCKAPTYRITPLNREIADMLVAVNRAYNKSDYIPTIAWGRNARFAGNLEVGERVVLAGRIQSREYQKKQPNGNTVTMTAYEVSVSKICTTNNENDIPYELIAREEESDGNDGE